MGKKPSKTKRFEGIPDCTRAGTNAVAPGRHSTRISLRMHSLTNKKPGSEMPGVPASVMRAKLLPAFICSTRCVRYLYARCAGDRG